MLIKIRSDFIRDLTEVQSKCLVYLKQILLYFKDNRLDWKKERCPFTVWSTHAFITFIIRSWYNNFGGTKESSSFFRCPDSSTVQRTHYLFECTYSWDIKNRPPVLYRINLKNTCYRLQNHLSSLSQTQFMSRMSFRSFKSFWIFAWIVSMLKLPMLILPIQQAQLERSILGWKLKLRTKYSLRYSQVGVLSLQLEFKTTLIKIVKMIVFDCGKISFSWHWQIYQSNTFECYPFQKYLASSI